ncbi:MAG: laccase domain-containing protein, partial [Sulfurimonas sp.]|nr:laccase domain-containing protein [Sulfurimonas sp.]
MKFYHSKLLNSYSNLTHVYTTKKSGNLAFHVNDDSLHVRANHKQLAKELNYNVDSLIHMKQIHSDIVHIVDNNDNFSNPPECDA